MYNTSRAELRLGPSCMMIDGSKALLAKAKRTPFQVPVPEPEAINGFICRGTPYIQYIAVIQYGI